MSVYSKKSHLVRFEFAWILVVILAASDFAAFGTATSHAQEVEFFSPENFQSADSHYGPTNFP